MQDRKVEASAVVGDSEAADEKAPEYGKKVSITIEVKEGEYEEDRKKEWGIDLKIGHCGSEQRLRLQR